MSNILKQFLPYALTILFAALYFYWHETQISQQHLRDDEMETVVEGRDNLVGNLTTIITDLMFLKGQHD